MREIKFRAWIDGKYDYKPYLNGNGYYVVFEYGNVIGHRKDVVIEQFTGLKDKNGKEIYEGDIIKVLGSFYGDYLIPIVYDNINGFYATDNHNAVQLKNPDNWKEKHDKVHTYGFMMNRYSQICGGYNNTYNHKLKSYDIEIIGNIHENQGLLKEK